MPLTGPAKVDYQREYMRRRRSNAKMLDPVRPATEDVRPDTLEQPSELEVVDDFATGDTVVEPQSHSPMMVGYVPPTD